MMCVCVYWTAVYISPLSIAHAVFFFLFILTDCGDGCQNGPCGEGTDEEEGNHNYWEHLGQMPTQIALYPATMGRHVPMVQAALPMPELVP